MSKREYIYNLLALCTEKQKDLFGRMYPEGPKNIQVDIAVAQIERTLKDLNSQNEEMVEMKKAAALSADVELNKRREYRKTITGLEVELREANVHIERLSNARLYYATYDKVR